MNNNKIVLWGSIGVIVLLVIIMITSMPIWGEDSESEEMDNIPRLEQDEQFTIEDMTTFIDDDYKGEEDIVVDEKLSITDLLKQKRKDKDSRYDNENDSANLKIQQEITRMEAEQRTLQAPVANPKRKVREKKESLTYEERLLQSKKEMLAEYEQSNQKILEYIEPLTFLASVYPEGGALEEYVLPGQKRRVRLSLEEEVSVNGEIFPEGTLIFANISIQQSRVLFDVKNIQGVPISVTSYDYNDRNIGVYSERAGELWNEFANDALTNTAETAAGDYGREIGSTTMGNVARGLTRFLSRKSMREDEKIPLSNTLKVIFSNQ